MLLSGRAAWGLLMAMAVGLLSFAAPAAPPTVVSTAPQDGASSVILGAGIVVTFSTAMDHPSTESAFSLLPVTAGAFSWNGATLTFTPTADLAPSTPYQISIGATAQDSLGNPLGTPFTSAFTTGTIAGTPLPPGLIKTLIHLGAAESDRITDFPLNGVEMNAMWDHFQLGGLGPEHLQQPVDGRAAPLNNITTTQTPLVWTAMTDSDGDGIWDNNIGVRYASYAALYIAVPTPRRVSIDAQFNNTFSVYLDGNPTPVFNNVSPSPAFDLTQGLHILLIKHGNDSGGDFYTLRLTDELGADLPDLRYVLDDVIPPHVLSIYPAAAATGVLTGSDVVIQFNEAMDTTVATSGVAALTGGSAVGTWAWTDAYTLVWTPGAPLATATLYTVTITPGQAKDLRGLALTGTSVFNFTTAAASTPAAASILPTSAVSGANANLVTLFGTGFQQGAILHPAGALPYGGHYYKFSGGWDLWNNARPLCSAAGGHLATLNSVAEDDFVWRLGARYNCWMGMSDVVLPGGWVWEDGEPVTYTNWLPGEPNNFIGQGEHWGAYWYAFGWNDTVEASRPYVCEFENAATPTVHLSHVGQSDIPATNVFFNSAGSVSFDLDLSGAFPGTWDVVLTNPDGSTTTLSAAFTVHPPPPTVVNVTSSTANGTYNPGQTISIQVQFSAAVTVVGTPQLTLETGPTDAVVDYTSGSGTSTLTFQYTIAIGDNSADLDYASTSALAANGGTIRNATNSDAILTLPTPGAAGSLAANKALQIVTPPPPTVTNVTSTAANGTYGLGQILAITVTFSQPVTVTGTPQLTLETGPSDAVVDYTSGSGTSTLTFQYTVASGHNSADLDYVSASALSANGGTIRNATSSDAILTLPSPGAAGSLGANKAIQIVTPVPPIVTNVTSTATNGTYASGDVLTVTVTFSQAVLVTGTPLLTLETGAVDAVASFATGSGTATLSFTYTVSAADATLDLDYVAASALGLNGGTIRNASALDALLTLPAPGAAGSLGANKDLAISTPVIPPTPPPPPVDLKVGGCGLTGAEVLLLLVLLRFFRRKPQGVTGLLILLILPATALAQEEKLPPKAAQEEPPPKHESQEPPAPAPAAGPGIGIEVEFRLGGWWMGSFDAATPTGRRQIASTLYVDAGLNLGLELSDWTLTLSGDYGGAQDVHLAAGGLLLGRRWALSGEESPLSLQLSAGPLLGKLEAEAQGFGNFKTAVGFEVRADLVSQIHKTVGLDFWLSFRELAFKYEETVLSGDTKAGGATLAAGVGLLMRF